MKFKGLLLVICLTYQPLLGSMTLLHDRLGTRPTGMGGAYTAVAEGSESIFYNWAKPSEHPYTEWKLDQASILETPLYVASFQNIKKIPYLRGGFAISQTSNIPYTELNDYNQPELSGGNFNQQLLALYTSTYTKLWNSHIGLRSTYFYETLENETGQSFQLDGALFKQLTVKHIPINLGITIKNMFKSSISWSTGTNDSSPWMINAGIQTKHLNNMLSVAMDIEKEDNIKDLKYYIGSEYWILGSSTTNPSMTLRGGTKNGSLCLGVGIQSEGWLFDYSWTEPELFNSIDSGENPTEHRFSIGRSLFPFKPTPSPHKGKNRLVFKNEFDSLPSNILPKFEQTIQKSPKMLHLSNIKVNNQTNICNYKSQIINPDLTIRLNQTTQTDIQTVQLSQLPLKILATYKNEKDIIIIDIEKNNENTLIFSGYLPKEYTLMINNRLIYPDKKNSSFFTKVKQGSQTYTESEILILKHPPTQKPIDPFE